MLIKWAGRRLALLLMSFPVIEATAAVFDGVHNKKGQPPKLLQSKIWFTNVWGPSPFSCRCSSLKLHPKCKLIKRFFPGAVSDVEMQEHYDEFFEVSLKHAHNCTFFFFFCATSFLMTSNHVFRKSSRKWRRSTARWRRWTCVIIWAITSSAMFMWR